jgi:hypothetical protein
VYILVCTMDISNLNFLKDQSMFSELVSMFPRALT